MQICTIPSSKKRHKKEKKIPHVGIFFDILK